MAKQVLVYNPRVAPVIIGRDEYRPRTYALVTPDKAVTLKGTELVIEGMPGFRYPWLEFNCKI